MNKGTGPIIGEVNIKHATGRYIDEFVRLKCAPDLLLMGVFPNAKEITESFAAYRAAQNYISRFALADPSVTVYCVADGCTPRTGATFAYRSAWQCASIDPALRDCGRWAGIRRLRCMPCRVEDGHYHVRRNRKTLIVAVHSHANLQVAVDKLRGDDTAVIALPCCKPQELDRPPDYDYQDFGIWSPKRRVLVWEKL